MTHAEPDASALPNVASPAPRDAAHRAEFDRYFAVRTHAGNLALAPDGSEVAYIANTSGQFNIWRQSVRGGWPWQVTTFERETVRSVLWTASGDLIGMADADGSEQYQLFAVPATGGAVRTLTHRPDVQYQFSAYGLAPDGRTVAFAGNDREPTDGDVQVLDVATGAIQRLLANGRYNFAGTWSPDGRMLNVIDLRSNTDMHLWLVERASGAAREALAHDDEFTIEPGPWLPDGSGFYVLCDRGREFKGIARYLLATDALEWVLTPEWDVEGLAVSRDGRRMLWVLNESGRSQVYLRDDDGAAQRVVGLPLGVIEDLHLAPDGETLAVRINAATAPAEVYIVSFGPIGTRAQPQLRRLTHGMLGGLGPEALVEPELVNYPTFDGRQIPGWLYRPRSASEHHQAPIVLAIHGGPEAQERVQYRALYQYLLARGIGVFAPNIRGSTGYGVAYQKLIHRDWGGAELRDIESAALYLRELPWVSPQRLGVYGGSFGGFATLSAVTRLPDYWAAAVDIVGPSNLLTFVGSVPPTWRRVMASMVGDAEADATMLRERSPITYVEQARAPLLVLQGANDPRVVQAESDQMVERLRSLGRSVEYVVFEDEGHGFAKRANQLRSSWLTAEFLQRHLHAHHAHSHESHGV